MIILDLLVSNKSSSLIQSKYGNFVFQRAIKLTKSNETLKKEVKEVLNKKIAGSNSKEKQRITYILDLLVD